MTSNKGLITLSGSVLAFTSGACLSVGMAMMSDHIADLESMKKNLPHKILGGGLFVLGLYIFSPAVLREAWIHH